MPSPSIIPDSTLAAISSLLQETAKTPKPLTVEQLLIRERNVLRTMLRNGHSHDDIALVFVHNQLTVSGQTVEAVLARLGKKKGVKTKQGDTLAEEALTVSHDAAGAIAAEWKRLSTIRKGLTRQELVAAMQDDIQAALEVGYTYADIAALLTTKGIKIAASSLQRYHRVAKQPANASESPKALNTKPSGDESETQTAQPPSSRPAPSRFKSPTNLLDEEFIND
ncbi:hypothetical protein PN498_13200 [Oscillatoria sp. CS-180]|uniref:hypothetical protein n=1 Tax=Oscillatoria sp. CS-180 TaxID=3021720 RepID=UPI0023306395|nr:hypothetical protein [Oscillatoria sp. CS-180]MDB9526950.1 hypothetical protein [Oscillatoria sp. CS-180]